MIANTNLDFREIREISLTKPPFGVRSCEVAIIDQIYTIHPMDPMGCEGFFFTPKKSPPTSMGKSVKRQTHKQAFLPKSHHTRTGFDHQGLVQPWALVSTIKIHQPQQRWGLRIIHVAIGMILLGQTSVPR